MSSVEKVETQPVASFVITADDGNKAGHADYVEYDGQRVFFHTEISEDYGGQGLASTLVRAALEDTAAEGLTAVAVCPFVLGWLEKHPDEIDIQWRKPRPADISAVQEKIS